MPVGLLARWATVVAWMGGIFYLSSRPDPLFFVHDSMLRALAGAAAHAVEYFGLVLLLHGALSTGSQASPGSEKVRSRRISWVPLILALAYALLDEIHQEFVPGRGFELTDLGYDAAGMALALAWRGAHRGAGRESVPAVRLARGGTRPEERTCPCPPCAVLEWLRRLVSVPGLLLAARGSGRA